jgi:single-stranded DNA-binding protein
MSFNSINRVELQGRVGTVRMSPGIGSIVANFSLVTEHPIISAEGCHLVESTWHNVAAFEGGEVSLEGLTRGAMVHLTGRLRIAKYTSVDGTERTFTEVLADSLRVTNDAGNRVQILKESASGQLSMQEAMVIVPLTKAYYDDRANGYIAVSVELPDGEDGFALVDKLNDISVNAGGAADWYVGDENEEYVDVN